MQKHLYLLSGTDAFTRGTLDNVALVENAVGLDQSAGRYLLYGCFTTQEISFPAFRQLAMSWNAFTPKGTVVEPQARVLVDGVWTDWLSFGRWSPHIQRESIQQKAEKPAYVQGDTLYVPAGKATHAQMRIYLYTSDDQVTPLVQLLAVSVRPAEWHPEPAEPYGRLIRLPAYSQRNRDPQLQQGMSAAICLTSMMNRWGQDALPEELAWGMYDFGQGDCFHHGFMTALAGNYGYMAYRAYLSPQQVWELVKQGCSVALRMSYAASQDSAARLGLPHLPDAFADGEDQCMILRGFAVQDNQIQVLVNDSLAPTDREAECSYPATQFWAAYTGEAIIMQGRCPSMGRVASQRIHCGLIASEQEDCYWFESPQGEILPLDGEALGTLCCTQQPEVAYATTAHKPFFYLERQPDGTVCLKGHLEPGRLTTVYAVYKDGSTFVAQLRPTEKPAEKSPEQPVDTEN